jgi:hypothetical protein
MKKLSLITIFLLSIIATFLSTWSLIRSYIVDEQDLEYTIYIGTNDKDTFQLEIPLDEARSIIYNTMINYFSDGFTMHDANGVWKDENDAITLEYTFVCIIENADIDEIYKAADELILKLDQNSILIVSNRVEKVDFYTGKK